MFNPFEELLEIAKSSRSVGHNSVHFNSVAANKMRFPRIKIPKTRFVKQHNFGRVQSTRTRLKSTDSLKELENVAKGFATEMSPSTIVTVRPHKRLNVARKNANTVGEFKKRKFKDPAQMRGIKNVGDV